MLILVIVFACGVFGNQPLRAKQDSTYFYEDFGGNWRSIWTNNNHFTANADGLYLATTAPSPTWTSVQKQWFAEQQLGGMEWEIGLEINGALTSGNHIRIYLSADQSDLTSAHQGYHLQIDGASGNHFYKLYRQNGSRRSMIFQSEPIPNQSAQYRAKVRVVHNEEGVWQIFADEYDSGNFERIHSSSGQDEIEDNTYDQLGYVGFWFNFTVTRRTDFNIQYMKVNHVSPEIQPKPLAIESIQWEDPRAIIISYSGLLDTVSGYNANHYTILPQIQYPDSIAIASGNIKLFFPEELAAGWHHLSIHGLSEASGFNTIDTSFRFLYEKIDRAIPYDIIINEIMANPRNAAELPQQEYIELYNTSEKTIHLKNWQFSSSTTTAILPDIKMAGLSYLILCRTQDTSLFSNYGRTVGLQPWPILTNSGTVLSLHDELHNVIDIVSYSDQWYQDNTKRQGGWSLERKNPLEQCMEDNNWSSSIDPKGGTPGHNNSIFEELILLETIQKEVKNNQQITITFNKILDSIWFMTETLIKVKSGFSSFRDVEANKIVLNPYALQLKLDIPLATGNKYTFQINHLRTCDGVDHLVEFSYEVAENVLPGEILINEVLFNPLANGVDFVELYNYSNKTFNLQTLYLGNLNNQGGRANITSLNTEHVQWLPKSYLAFATDPDITKQHYPRTHADRVISLESMPNYNNDQGHVLLFHQEVDGHYTLIDSLHYWEKMHSPLLTQVKGVSLERQSWGKATNALGNFRSAAISEGGATPGYENSVSFESEEDGEHWVRLESSIFSPDSDGFQDFMLINYGIPVPNLMAHVIIFDKNRRPVRTLGRNTSIPAMGTLQWDGRSDHQVLQPPGIYTLYISFYNDQGYRKVVRKSFVLAVKI